MSIVIHTNQGRFALEPRPDDTLAKAIFLSRLWLDVPLCSGLGKCGLCRVRYVSDAPEASQDESRRIGKDRLADGWRLSCLHPATDCEIELPEPVRSQPTMRTLSGGRGDFKLAVDLGTTSIHWTALVKGQPVATGQDLNPQMGLGSEVMSRLKEAGTAKGLSLLRTLISDHLAGLANRNAERLGGRCTSLAVSGNSAMTYILLGLKPDDLAVAPYALSYVGGDEKMINAGLPPAYIPPLLAPFIGADLSAGLTAIEYNADPGYPFLLADLGTNGEFILALSPTKRICASVPMGPALEGIGLSFGRMAGPGTVTGFDLTPNGLELKYFDGPPNGRPGMTGTAYLSLAAILLRHGVLDETGQFGQGNTPMAAKLAANLTTMAGEPSFAIANGLHLPASDVEEILKVKAAFNLAMSTLLAKAGFGTSGLAAIHLAGALGEHVNPNDLETIGFLPPGCKAITIKAGNTSLKGTELILTDTCARAFAETLPDTITTLDLTSEETFGERYLERMRFNYVD